MTGEVLEELVIKPMPDPPKRSFTLGIVGTRLVKDALLVRRIIEYYIQLFTEWHRCDLTVISGGAEGVDTIAEEVAREAGVKFIAYLPNGDTWEHYRERNKRIVEDCDMLLVIRYKDSKTYGSGWTRDYAKRIGKRVVSIEIEEVV